MPLDHHEPFALQTIHDRNVLLHRSSDPVHDQGQATGQETSTENCGSEREVRTRSVARMCAIEQVTYAPLNHQDGQGKNRTDAKPPGERSHRLPRREQRAQKPLLSATLAEGSRTVKQPAICPHVRQQCLETDR